MAGQNKMKRKIDYLKILKIALGAGISIVLAEWIGLNFSPSAGVITLLSIQDTKKETIRVMLRRLVSFGVSLILSAACFTLFGYGALAVGVFLLFFSAFCILFHMQEGISVNTVLITHFLTEQSMSAENIVNELLLLLVGAGIGVVLNLYIPGKKKQIKIRQQLIETRIKGILRGMSEALSGKSKGCQQGTELSELDKELDQGERSAYEEMENTLLSETRYYLRYMNMRKVQALVLYRIEEHICRLRLLPPQAKLIAGLIEHISGSFHEYNNALELLTELNAVKLSMREQPLPTEREEFENRAVLFQILLELEQFLVMKKEFVEELSEDEIKEFWKYRTDSRKEDGFI